jgi:outer membrane protein TolC
MLRIGRLRRQHHVEGHQSGGVGVSRHLVAHGVHEGHPGCLRLLAALAVALVAFGDGRGQARQRATLVFHLHQQLGLEFALPIYQGGLVSSQVREAVANQERVRQELEDALRNAALQTRDAYFNVLSTQSQVKALEAALASSMKSLESTQVGLEVGVRTNIDVLNAQQQVTSAQKELALARYLSLIALLDLKASAGTLTAADLEQIDRMLVVAQ